MTVGFNSGVASGRTQAFRFLLDFALTAPLSHQTVERTEKPRFGAWFNTRLSGQTQATTPSVKQFVAGFESTVVSGSATDVVHTADVLGGVEVSIGRGFNFGRDHQLEPLLIAALGFSTTTPPDSSPPVFKLTDKGREVFLADIDPMKRADFNYVGFVQPDRRSFDHQWYVGLRLKTHHFESCTSGSASCSRNARRNFPGTIDIAIGRNGAVSGGSLRHAVLRLDTFYPLPSDSIANAVYFFGSAFVHLTRQAEAEPVFLAAPDGPVPVPSPQLHLYTLTAADRRRDLWKFGVAVDLVRLFKGAGHSPDAQPDVAPVPGTTVFASEEVAVRRLVWNQGDKVELAPGDLLVPVRIQTSAPSAGGSGMLVSGQKVGDQEMSVPVAISEMKPFVLGSLVAVDASAPIWLASPGTASVNALVMRAVAPPSATKEPKRPAARGLNFESPRPFVGSTFVVDKLTLQGGQAAEAVVTGAATVLVAASSGLKYSVGVGGAEKDLDRGQVVVVGRGESYRVTSAGAGDLLIVAIR